MEDWLQIWTAAANVRVDGKIILDGSKRNGTRGRELDLPG
jgi:hypothetical protein